MEQLVKKRGIAKGKITRLQTRADDAENMTVHEAEVLLERLSQAWTEFCEQQDQILMLTDEDEAAKEETAYAIEEERHDKIKSLLMSYQNGSVKSELKATSSSRGMVKLPKLDLPSFSGNYVDWRSFIDQFDCAVHRNSSLSDVQKLQYLKGCVKGDASRLLSSLTLTDENYEIARKSLFSRYDNKRLIVREHIHAIVSFAPLKSECSAQLRNLVETFEKHLLALKSLELEVESWDPFLVYLISEKLDGETRKYLELDIGCSDLPEYSKVKELLEVRCRALESCSSATSVSKSKTYEKAKSPSVKSSSFGATPESCAHCKGPHSIYSCSKFKGLSVSERVNAVFKNKLCLNCLAGGHSAKDCQSANTCRTCSRKHHSLLHKENNSESHSQSASLVSRNEFSQVLLATALVPVLSKRGEVVYCRALLDGGSQGCLLSEACAQQLGVKREKILAGVVGVGKKTSKCNGLAMVQFCHESLPEPFPCLILSHVTNDQPSSYFEFDTWPHITEVDLADPSFNMPAPVDLLLGREVCNLVTLGNKIRVGGSLFLEETIFGWSVSGCLQDVPVSNIFSSLNCSLIESAESTLRRFWELEDLPQATRFSTEEALVEEHFVSTTKRLPDGRFCVKLPFKSESDSLSDTYSLALRRLFSMERRFQSSPKLKEQYIAFIKEFCDLGHMEAVPDSQLSKSRSNCFFLPHHAVFKESSTTTKLRVVFDGSAHTTGSSLNSSLMVGPKIQQDLFNILVRFRFHAVALSADVAKMYRQVALDNNDRDYHRILWRENSSEPVRELRMTRVTYGIASSAFHSIRALHEAANLCNDPAVAKVVKEDFYVDDLISGASSVEEAIVLQRNLVDSLRAFGFELRKWSSSQEAVISELPVELREVEDLSFDETHSIKTLGISWRPVKDVFFFCFSENQTVFTKRSLLADTSKVFDPLGWLSPLVIKLKALFQECWCLGLDWDDELPETIKATWMQWRNSFCGLSKLTISRFVLSAPDAEVQIHIFSDASETAYAAACYIRSVSRNGSIRCKLLCAKTRVSPVKAVSLPRLELCGALLAARLLVAVKKSLASMDLNVTSVHAWTDSTIVLAWLAELPRKWACFVANRVAEIQEVLPLSSWRHVESKLNPADCATRGLNGYELASFELWWNGPCFLLKSEDEWPSKIEGLPDPPEKRRAVEVLTTSVHVEEFDISRFSSLLKLKYTVAFVLRVREFCKKRKVVGPVTAKELANAEAWIVRLVQKEAFFEEIACLQGGKPLKSSSKLISLNPFLDDRGVIRVGGRLANSDLNSEQKNPIVIPKDSHFTVLVVRSCHASVLHSGPQLTLAKVNQRFWIVNGRDLVRRLLHSCVKCSRFSKIVQTPLMGQLPEERVSLNRPFLNTGVDYGGPFQVKSKSGRGFRLSKCYLALFVCLSTKAVHLELVSDLTTEGFLAALRRFVSRRGLPSKILSDNGTNFVGASNEIKAVRTFLQDSNFIGNIVEFSAHNSISWEFIPPGSPHFGGLWEAGIKSAKSLMRKVVGETILTFEELYTFSTQVEACLNSRPLTLASSDPNDLQPLTPGHFLVGGPLNSVPEVDSTMDKISSLKRWHLVQQQFQHFWKRWKTEYLSTLQRRIKWQTDKCSLKVGDVVLLTDHSSPLHWPMGRITQLHPGSDGVSRVATVKLQHTTLKRPCTKLRYLCSSD